jgi:ATP adenylyltransferase
MSDEQDSNPYALQRMWAPWRLEYIQGQKTPQGCPFCELPKEEPSEENLLLYVDDEIFVVMNRYPYNPQHLLVIPRAHIGRPEDLPPAVWTKLSGALRLCVELLRQGSNPPGFNLGMNAGSVGGAGLPDHLHWHIVPRWAGDTNFMPVIAETKTLPVHNRSVWQTLRPRFLDFGRKLAET